MKQLSLSAILCLCSIALFGADYNGEVPSSERTKTIINTGWKFHLGDPDATLFLNDLDESTWETVSIPHTLKLTSLTLDLCDDDKTQPTFHRTVGWYRKNIVANANNKKVFLEFEGAHQVTDLWVNEKHLGQFAVGGYSPFHFDISKYVNRGGQNQITIRVDNRRSDIIPPDPGPFDYVKFSGLYRDVYLVETDLLHINYNWEALKAGIYITTPSVDVVNPSATIDIKTVVKNEYSSSKTAIVTQRIINKEGLVILKLAAEAEIAAGNTHEFDQIGAIEDDVQLWSIENPYLYRVNTTVSLDGKVVDMQENKLGIRTFALDNEKGFMLNGKPIELIGFNRHQHFPYIGDALPNSLHYKDMLQFKELGFNVMRTAHYPQDDAIIEACDELGILVYEEAPSWITVSKFDGWWDNFEKSARIMVRNHRNHPSIVIWGAGINHRGYVPRANSVIKQEDPWRLTASQGARWTGWQASGLTDINANMLYGPFIWDRSETILAMEGRHGAAEVAKYKRDPQMTGIISWTAHAYYTFHPTHAKNNSKIDRTRGGQMTIFRQPRPAIMWYPSELNTDPYIYVVEDWTEKVENLTVYSNAEVLSLNINGKDMGIFYPSDDSVYFGLDHPPYHIPINNFEKGVLNLKGYVGNELMMEQSIQTPEKAKSIRLVADQHGRTWDADGSDILSVKAQVVDKNGTLIKDFKGDISFSIKGDAQIIGDKVNINANPMYVENGEAPILLQAGTQVGSVTLKGTCKGLISASITLQTSQKNNDAIANTIKKVYDFEKIRVDLGAPDQITQFGWNEWSNTDNTPASTNLNILGGIEASFHTNSDDGILRWLGEMNVVGKYGFAYGDGVLGVDEKGVTLSFKALPKGTYKLKTWHHAPRTNTDVMDPNKDKLKSLRVLNIPYATSIDIMSGDVKVKLEVTEGKQMQFQAAATTEIILYSDGVNTVDVTYKDTNSEKGIWINAFELSEWNIDLK